MDALEVAFSHPLVSISVVLLCRLCTQMLLSKCLKYVCDLYLKAGRTDCNHIFLNFVPTLNDADPSKVSCDFVAFPGKQICCVVVSHVVALYKVSNKE
jgi:hypothetical protein